ncbi:MAG: hypothetical protein FWC00_05055 [Firmicutes bacterium]|nr:hypothetical protein [Bacillota bacterium]
MEFIKNELIDEVLQKYFATFSITLDTAEFVPDKYGRKIHKFIFKNMKKKFREVNRAYKQKKKQTGGEAVSLRASPPVAK